MYPVSKRVGDQLANTFTYHPPKGSQAQRYEMLRGNAQKLAFEIATFTPESREQSLALTKLEEAIFFANAAIARNEVWDGNKMIAPMELEFTPGS